MSKNETKYVFECLTIPATVSMKLNVISKICSHHKCTIIVRICFYAGHHERLNKVKSLPNHCLHTSMIMCMSIAYTIKVRKKKDFLWKCNTIKFNIDIIPGNWLTIIQTWTKLIRLYFSIHLVNVWGIKKKMCRFLLLLLVWMSLTYDQYKKTTTEKMGGWSISRKKREKIHTSVSNLRNTKGIRKKHT